MHTAQHPRRPSHVVALTSTVVAALSHLVIAVVYLLADAPQQVDTVRVVGFLIVATCAVVSVVVVRARTQWGRAVSLAPVVVSAGVLLAIAGLTALSIGPLWLPGIAGTLFAVALLSRTEP